MSRLDSILNPVDMLLDTVHFASKIQAQDDLHIGCTFRAENKQRAPIEPKEVDAMCLSVNSDGILSPSEGKSALPPSTSSRLLSLCVKDGYMLDLPAFELNPRVRRPEILSSAWEESIKLACVPIDAAKAASPEGDNPWACVTVSTVEHDNGQLVWGRKSRSTGVLAPTCVFGDDCEALTIRGNQVRMCALMMFLCVLTMVCIGMSSCVHDTITTG